MCMQTCITCCDVELAHATVMGDPSNSMFVVADHFLSSDTTDGLANSAVYYTSKYMLLISSDVLECMALANELMAMLRLVVFGVLLIVRIADRRGKPCEYHNIGVIHNFRL